MQRGFKQAAERRAIALREALRLSPIAPLSARQLADHMSVPIISPPQVPGLSSQHLEQLLAIDAWGWSAVTIPIDDWALIIYNIAHPADRFESDVMHELAHLLCRHRPARMLTFPGFPFPLREFDPDQEEEAIWLGACLQLPRPALWWALRRGMDANTIATHFGASHAIVQYRRNVTGVDRQLAAARRRRTKSMRT